VRVFGGFGVGGVEVVPVDEAVGDTGDLEEFGDLEGVVVDPQRDTPPNMAVHQCGERQCQLWLIHKQRVRSQTSAAKGSFNCRPGEIIAHSVFGVRNIDFDHWRRR